MAKGPIHHQRKHIGAILSLQPDGDQLALDRDTWNTQEIDAERQKSVDRLKATLIERGMPEDRAEMLAERSVVAKGVRRLALDLRKAMNANRSGSRGSNRDQRVTTMENDAMAVEIATGDGFRFEAVEFFEPRARFLLSDGHGRLNIFIARLNADWMLNVRQDEDTFSVTEVIGDKLIKLQQPDFVTFYSKHGRYVRTRLLPVLTHYGVSILTPGSPPVVKKVLALLADPIDTEERRKVRALLDQLGGRDYQKRQDAAKALKESYPRWMGLIRDAVVDPDTNAEAAARLNKIIHSHRGGHRELRLIHALHLTEDVEYLRDLLKSLEGEEAELVSKRIEALGGGTEPATGS
jgi:hypothetical protein